MSATSTKFLEQINKAEAEVLGSMISSWSNPSNAKSSLATLVGADNLDMAAGDAADLPTVVQMNTNKVATAAAAMRDIGEAARARRDIGISAMTRTERFLSAIDILNARRESLLFSSKK